MPTLTVPPRAPELVSVEPAPRLAATTVPPVVVTVPPVTFTVPRAPELVTVPPATVTVPTCVPVFANVAPAATVTSATMPALTDVVPAARAIGEPTVAPVATSKAPPSTLTAPPGAITPPAETFKVPPRTVVVPVKVFTPPRDHSPAPSLTRLSLPGAIAAVPAESTRAKLRALPAPEPTRFRVRSKAIGAAMATAMLAVSPIVLIAVGALSVTSRVSRSMAVMVVPAVKAVPVMVEPTMMFSTPSRTTLVAPSGARAMFWPVASAT